MTTEQIQLDMRDLPELDSVTTGGRSNFVLTVIALPLISAVLGAGLAVITYFAVTLIAHYHISIHYCIGLGICAAVLIGALLIRSSLADWQWAADHDGITISGLLRKRHIRWSEITEAKPGARTGGKVYYLRTAKGRLSIGDMTQDKGEMIGAVLYQHLRRYGKADESLLSAGARTYWMPIPENVPAEMDWHHPHPPNWSILMAVTIIIAIAAPLIYLFGHKLKLGHFFNYFQHWGGVLVAAAYKKLRDRLIMARSVMIRHDHIEMRTPRRLIYLPWSDIRYVHWDNTHKSITLGKGMFSTVAVIPYLEKEPDSAACILSIIRHLRLAHHKPPVAIPTQLLPVLYSAGASPINAFPADQAVEIKVNNFTAAVVPGVLSFVMMAVVLWTISDPGRMIHGHGLHLVFLGPLVGLATGVPAVILTRTTLRADATGITVKTALKRRFIDWRDITNYVVASAGGAKSRRRLMGSSGQVILEIPVLDEAQPNMERFITLLDARLAHVRQHHLPTLTR